MVDKEHHILLKQGTEVWHKFRQDNPLTRPSLSRAELQDVKLDGFNLSRADLRGSDLSRASLRGADLREADLFGANLKNTDLEGAKLDRADLSGVDLTGANLNDVDLSEVDLSKAILRGVRGLESERSEVKQIEAIEEGTANAEQLRLLNQGAEVWNAWREKLQQERVRIEINLQGANLRGKKLNRFNLKFANLRKANLSGTDLSKSDLSGATLIETDLSNANFQDADLRGADFFRAKFNNATLDGAKLSKAELSGADFEGVDLSKIADLGEVDFSNSIRVSLRNILKPETRNNEKNSQSISAKAPFRLERVAFYRRIPFFTLLLGYPVITVLVALTIILLSGVYDSFVNGSGVSLVNGLRTSLVNNCSPLFLLSTALSPFFFWIALSFILNHSIAAFYFFNKKIRKITGWFIRFLGSVPTLILGNALLHLAEKTGVNSFIDIPILTPIFIFSMLLLMAIPTALQFGQVLLEEYEEENISTIIGGFGLGATRLEVLSYLILPSIRKPLNLAITIAIGRVIIEGYIAFDKPVPIVNEVQVLRDVFYSLYSTATIEKNFILILFLLVFAILGNLQLVPMMRQLK